MYRVAFYCPDTHIEYDGSTPYEIGVGGGVTARVRMAKALQKAGNTVTVVANCPQRSRFDGVDYAPLHECDSINTDVLISNTSGGALDLRPRNAPRIEAHTHVVWIQGTQKPAGLDHVAFDFLYAPSNYIAEIVHQQWGISTDRILVSYNPFEEDLFREVEKRQPVRDPWRLMYCAHPEKGLKPSIEILTRLRAIDPRFHLAVFGGRQLWGQEEIGPPKIAGLAYHGLVGQKQLTRELFKSGFSLCLQSRDEPFGMVVTESQRAGCVVIASKVGAYSEIIQHGENGYLMEGDPFSETVQAMSSSVIHALSENQIEAERIRKNARSVPWSSDIMARVWVGHWNWLNSAGDRKDRGGQFIDSTPCEICGARTLALEDGEHCLACGRYTPCVRTGL